MPSIGEQGWGNLVSDNFEILDTNLNDLQNQITTNLNNLNDLQDQIDVIDTNIGNGTRTLTLTGSVSLTPDFQQYWEGNVYVMYMNNDYTMTESIKPSSSARLYLIICNGNLTITESLDTYPTNLRNETPPNSPSNNVYSKTISTNYSDTITLPYTKSNNSAVIEFSKSDLKSFLDAVTYNSVNYTLSIPAATAAGGTGDGANGTAGTAENTCNGGGGGGNYSNRDYTGGTGCIFGQYAGGNINSYRNGYGYGSNASSKYRCGLVIIANGNLTINESCTITQNGGNGNYALGGYGGGAPVGGGGGGAPVFIYYTGSYVNNGTINTAGGHKSSSYGGGNGGAGGIKTTKISI